MKMTVSLRFWISVDKELKKLGEAPALLWEVKNHHPNTPVAEVAKAIRAARIKADRHEEGDDI